MNETTLKFVKVKLVDDFSLRSNKQITSPREILPLLIEELGMYDREVFAVVNLNIRLMPINVNICHIGAISSSISHPREILKASLLSNAHSVMLIHNHPSGTCEPSNQDIKVTKELSNAYKMVGIRTLDHIICSYNKEEYYSMRYDTNLEYLNMFQGEEVSDVEKSKVITRFEEAEKRGYEEEIEIDI